MGSLEELLNKSEGMDYSGREVGAKPGTEHKGGTAVGTGTGTRDGNQRDKR